MPNWSPKEKSTLRKSPRDWYRRSVSRNSLPLWWADVTWNGWVVRELGIGIDSIQWWAWARRIRTTRLIPSNINHSNFLLHASHFYQKHAPFFNRIHPEVQPPGRLWSNLLYSCIKCRIWGNAWWFPTHAARVYDSSDPPAESQVCRYDRHRSSQENSNESSGRQFPQNLNHYNNHRQATDCCSYRIVKPSIQIE